MASAWIVICPAPASGEVRDLELGALDHEMHVEQDVEAAQGLDHGRAHAQRRDEVAVHHVDVDHRRAGVDDLAHQLPEATEVGGEDARSDAGRGHARSSTRSGLREQRAAAVVAGHLHRRGHADDRAVLAAVRADGAQLEAVQAVDAADDNWLGWRQGQPRIADRPR